MYILDPIAFSPLSAFGFSCLPFLFFLYRKPYRFSPITIRLFDRLLLFFSGILILFLCLSVGETSEEWDLAFLLLLLLHINPLALTVLLLVKVGLLQLPSRTQYRKPLQKSPQIEQLGWDDIIANPQTKRELQSVMEILKDPRAAKKYGIDLPRGILLYGPPGTGKTTVAKVIANQAGLSFFVLKMDEIVSKWVGDSEKNLTALFEAALKQAPAIIFIDELDSIGKQRGGAGGQVYAENLLNHLLQLIDGVIRLEGVYVIGATNRPDLVDSALKRAGRLTKIIELALPTMAERKELFTLYLSRLKRAGQIDIQSLAKITEGKSGADIRAICNQAGLNAFKREIGKKKKDYLITEDDLGQALEEFIGKPSAQRAAS